MLSRRILLLISSLLLLVFTNTSAYTQIPADINTEKENEDKLFEKVFGRRQNNLQSVVAPFFVDGQQRGETTLILTPGNVPNLRFQATAFLQEMVELIRPDIYQQIQGEIDKEGNLTLEALQQNGLEATFSDRTLELRIQIPPAQRKTKISDLRGNGVPPEAENAVKPSKVSAYLNLRGGQDFVWSGTSSTNLGRQPLNLQFDGAVNVNGWVLEGGGNFNEGTDNSWRRSDLRLVRDDPKSSVRYVVGDVSTPTTGYQRSTPIIGFTAAKNFTLQPYRVTRPISQYEFFLERPSKVEVFVNNRLVETLQLPAGKQDVRDLPLSVGTNDVQLTITDDLGRVSQLNFSSALASELLAPGLQKFAYGIGFAAEQKNGVYSYNWEKPILSLSHHFGANKKLTVGGYFQGNTQQQVAGLEGIFATSIGNLGWDVALSNASNLGSSYAMKLRYDFLKVGKNNPSQRTFNLSLEHRGANFMQFDDENPKNKYSLGITAAYNQKLLSDINANLSLRYQLGRDETPDTHSINLGLSKYLRNGLGVNLNLSQNRNNNGDNEQRVYMSLSWLKQLPSQSLRTTSEFSSEDSFSNRFSWNSNPLEPFGNLRGSVEGVQKSGDYQLNTKLAYPGFRGNLELSHDFTRLGNGINTDSHRTRLNFGTAVVFADGNFGLSRPIDNSFAIVVPHQNLRGKKIGVNPVGESYFAQIDGLGSAVLPSFQPYNVSSIKIDSSQLPLGYDLGKENYNILPSYKSGVVIHVGTDATVFIKGKLILADGKPLSQKTAQVVSLLDTKWQPITLFTNKAGKFALTGLKPGRYEIRFNEESLQKVSFEIPKNTAGLYDIGTLTFSSVSSN
ncbi:fimbria/pilus outer membrane usher protein [Calothrix sp. PCC 6303]|uniref:fimbria/pilus outer membrane usher protein n=1 Tax=Calothrix sp. PCC 6303 TaxID=1170562 RepID=UPI0002A046B8|nr:fimbria/pilus outer membrane usher protein [Calothrix sp. PCC 6303]AFZ03979.1 fimbrial biogenesis outer membrane usher protein [Calothrix sp. PCC 6303]